VGNEKLSLPQLHRKALRLYQEADKARTPGERRHKRRQAIKVSRLIAERVS
jgi:hypothetical protein